MALLKFVDVRKRYGDRATGRLALDGLSLTIDAGELVAVLGTSGSGKSTLLHLAGALDVTYEGSIELAGHELRTTSDRELSRLRSESVGFVFQSYHLINGWSVRDNVALPASFARAAVKDLARRVDYVLEQVGLAGRGDDSPASLSGGQRQRVAVARALLLRPTLLLCDEPTGSLDPDTGDQILETFSTLHGAGSLTLVLVTHAERVAAIAQRVIRLENGRVADDSRTRGASS